MRKNQIFQREIWEKIKFFKEKYEKLMKKFF